MKKISLSGISHLRWGKILLPTGLLLVAIAGILQLYEVQAVLFPGNYYANELNLIRKECNFIDKGFISLRTEVAKLNALCIGAATRVTRGPTSSLASSSLPQPNRVRTTSESAWAATLHAAKKKRVYVARKLKYIDAMLQSMQLAIEQQETSHNVALSQRRPDLEKTRRQIQEIRIRCQTYSSELDRLSENLNQLEGCSNSSSVKEH
jgi:hypothetical protein